MISFPLITSNLISGTCLHRCVHHRKQFHFRTMLSQHYIEALLEREHRYHARVYVNAKKELFQKMCKFLNITLKIKHTKHTRHTKHNKTHPDYRYTIDIKIELSQKEKLPPIYHNHSFRAIHSALKIAMTHKTKLVGFDA